MSTPSELERLVEVRMTDLHNLVRNAVGLSELPSSEAIAIVENSVAYRNLAAALQAGEGRPRWEGTHNRPSDGKRCDYLHNGVICNKCGWSAPESREPDGWCPNCGTAHIPQALCPARVGGPSAIEAAAEDAVFTEMRRWRVLHACGDAFVRDLAQKFLSAVPSLAATPPERARPPVESPEAVAKYRAEKAGRDHAWDVANRALAERDRYRKALEEIDADWASQACRRIARRALTRMEPEE